PARRPLDSSPTRRSSDLGGSPSAPGGKGGHSQPQEAGRRGQASSAIRRWPSALGWMWSKERSSGRRNQRGISAARAASSAIRASDRKSTRLNSSHVKISY